MRQTANRVSLKPEGSLVLNGSSQYVTTPIKLSPAGFSLMFWMKFSKYVNNDRVVDQQDSGPTNGFSLVAFVAGTKCKLNAIIRNAGSAAASINSNAMEIGYWYHVAVSFVENSFKYYINGVLIADDISCTMSASTTDLILGKRAVASSNYFGGKLKDFIAFNREISEVEILAHYRSSEVPSDAMMHLPFISDANDISVHGNNGTPSGSPSYADDCPFPPRVTTTRQALENQNYLIRSGTLFEGFETFADWTKISATGSISEESEIVKEGDRSLKIISGDATTCYADKVINKNLSGASGFGFWVYIPSLTGFSRIAILLSSTTDYSKFFSINKYYYHIHEGWNYVEVATSDFSNTGGESWGNTFVRMRLRIYATAGTPSCYFDSIYINYYRRPKIIVTFDDSWESQYSKAFAYMSTLGLKGTIYTIGSKLGTENYCTLAQLQEMYAAGWAIGNHGSVNLATLGTVAEQEAEISLEEAYIDEFPTKKHYAYPFGGYDNNAIQALKNLGYLTARTIFDHTQSHLFAESMLLTRMGIFNTTSVASTKTYIDQAIARGAALLLNYHLIVDSGADVDTKVLTADFNAVMDYVLFKKNSDLADVVTVSEWYEGLSAGRETV